MSITGYLQGLETNAVGGIHIHEGGSNSLGQDCWYAAGHYWENGSVNGTKDVWADSAWHSNSEGIAFVNVTVSNYDPTCSPLICANSSHARSQLLETGPTLASNVAKSVASSGDLRQV